MLPHGVARTRRKAYLHKNSKQLGVSTENYSLWGSSAGARMVGDIVVNGDRYSGVPAPKAVVIVYTGHTSYSSDYPPTFIVVTEDDPIVNASTVDLRVANLRRVGVDVEYHKFRNTGHGFGLGLGTEAEGWLDKAARFWQKHINH